MRISELEGQRVAIWGYGREGRSVLAALRWRLPSQPVTVFCSVDEAASLEQLQDPALTIATQVDAAALSAFDVVVKSPGISPYTSPAADAVLNGVRVIGATTLWMAEPKTGARLCVTGTKGKSTTTALIAHLLPAQAGVMKAPVLVLNGADDTFVSKESIAEFKAEMTAANADWQFVDFGGAVHCFAEPSADGVAVPGCKYDERAADRAYAMMDDFLRERFAVE